VGSVEGRRVVLWSGQVVRVRGQRGTRVNMSRDRVLLFLIRKHALLLCGSEEKGDCNKVKLSG
jgi:hypothetical protein